MPIVYRLHNFYVYCQGKDFKSNGFIGLTEQQNVIQCTFRWKTMSCQLWVVRIILQTAEQQSSAVHTVPSILASNLQIVDYIDFCIGYKTFSSLKYMPNICYQFLGVVAFFTVILISIMHLSVVCSPVPCQCITVQKIVGYIS